MRLINATIATLDGNSPYGLIENGTVVIDQQAISWVGPEAELPTEFAEHEQTDLGGRLVTPAFIDCHTHIVHGGHRAVEFEMRLEGASYEEVARAGGGIVSTMRSTRAATVDELVTSALPRVDTLLAEGISMIEIKSGYGLDVNTELAMLRAGRAISTLRPLRVKTSFLGAHSLPPEYKDRADDYLEEICLPALTQAHAESLVDAVDGFCEGIAFTPEQIKRVFDHAKSLGLPVKLHAEQLSHLGGTALAAEYGALSADHLEYANDNDAKLMAAAGTVAVVLPGAFYTLRETQKPPIDSFRKHGVPIALATDSNPGSSPVTSLLLTMNMACTLFRMTPAEALAGATRNAAKALGVTDSGVIRTGLRADLAVWDVNHPAELAYRVGFNPLHQRIFGGACTV
ncbi:imidazolonepropionase [Chromatiales bacterium (ex Bugula neritina AB1)]|nr:imidazolonepropionase [Chromatiales bacterium (ex Bugula neritina AB1)]